MVVLVLLCAMVVGSVGWWWADPVTAGSWGLKCWCRLALWCVGLSSGAFLEVSIGVAMSWSGLFVADSSGLWVVCIVGVLLSESFDGLLLFCCFDFCVCVRCSRL